jgi:hypothetical protein
MRMRRGEASTIKIRGKEKRFSQVRGKPSKENLIQEQWGMHSAEENYF